MSGHNNNNEGLTTSSIELMTSNVGVKIVSQLNITVRDSASQRFETKLNFGRNLI